MMMMMMMIYIYIYIYIYIRNTHTNTFRIVVVILALKSDTFKRSIHYDSTEAGIIFHWRPINIRIQKISKVFELSVCSWVFFCLFFRCFFFFFHLAIGGHDTFLVYLRKICWWRKKNLNCGDEQRWSFRRRSLITLIFGSPGQQESFGINS